MKYFVAILSCLLVTGLQAQPRLMLPVGHTQNITAMAVSPSGKFVLSAAEDNTIILWERISGRPVRQYFLKKELPLDLCFVNDEAFLCLFKNKKLAFVDLASGTARYETESGILATSLLRIGKHILLYSYVPGDGMEVRNITDGRLVHQLPAREVAVYDSTSGMLATTNSKSQLLVYNTRDFSLQHTVDEFAGNISAIAAAGDGQWVTGTNTGNVFMVKPGKSRSIIYTHEGTIKKIIARHNRVTSIAGKACLVYDMNGDSLVFGQAFKKDIEDIFQPASMQDSLFFILENGVVGQLDLHNRRTTSYAAHKGWSGKLLDDGQGGFLSYCDDDYFRRWTSEPFVLQRTYRGNLSGALYTAYDKKQQLLFTGYAGQPLKIRDLRMLNNLPAGLDSIETESISPLYQDSICLVTTRKGTVLHYNYLSKSVTDSFYFPADSLPQNMLSQTAVPDGAIFFAGDNIVQHINYQQAVLFWQPGEQKPVNSLWPVFGLRGVEAGPAGKHLLIRSTSPLLFRYETTGDSSAISLAAELQEPMEHARFSHDETSLLYTTDQYQGLTFYDITAQRIRNRRRTSGEITCLSPVSNLNMIAAATGDSLLIAGLKSASVKKAYPLRAGLINHMSWINDQNLLLAAQDGRITCINIDDGKILFSYILFPDNQQMVVTPEGYYLGDRDKVKQLTFEQQLGLIGFEQLDVRYNRPDKVLERLGQVFGTTDTALIHSYRRAYHKRMQRLGVDTSSFRDGYGIPEADFAGREKIKYDQRDSLLRLRIRAKDSRFALTRLHLRINEVPLFGMKGLPLKRRPGQVFDTTITVRLSQGENYIETSAVNTNGGESYRIPLIIKYAPTAPAPEKLYFAGIGINRFREPGHDLHWSVKDIRDLCVALQLRYGNNLVIIDTLFDERVTEENIRMLRSKLAAAGTDDKILLAYSGHGLLSREYDYYLSTYPVNFREPSNGGLPYETLEALMDGLSCRKKLMLIDACHSGELDKQEVIKIKAVAAAPGITAKGTITESTDTTAHLGLHNSFELMQSLFVNVSKGTGATIISAAAGTQFAQEKGTLQNGVFTYAILRALGENKKIRISELKKRVSREVVELTNGLQQPTSRQETLLADWEL